VIQEPGNIAAHRDSVFLRGLDFSKPLKAFFYTPPIPTSRCGCREPHRLSPLIGAGPPRPSPHAQRGERLELNPPYMWPCRLGVPDHPRSGKEKRPGLHSVAVGLADRQIRTRWRDRADRAHPACMKTPPQGPQPQDRVEAIRRAGDPAASLRHQAPRHQKSLRSRCFSLPARQEQRGHRGLPRCLSLDFQPGCSPK